MDRRNEIKQWLKEILENNLSGLNYSAFIFGSQANKTVLKKADIDIGIMADKSIPAKTLAGIYKAVEELPMLYNVDIVDFFEVDKTFTAVAMRNVEML